MKTKAAIKHFKSAKGLARALGITREAIYQWRENVPPLRAYQLREMGVPGEVPEPRRSESKAA